MIARARLHDGHGGHIEMNVNFDVPGHAYTGDAPGRLVVAHFARLEANALAVHLLGKTAYADLIAINGVQYSY